MKGQVFDGGVRDPVEISGHPSANDAYIMRKYI